MSDDIDTTDVPTAQFAQHVLTLAAEGDVKWQVSDEVKDKLNYSDVFRAKHVENIETTEEHVEIYCSLSSSVSEKVARASRWQPAEYANHDVTIYVTVTMDWPDDQYQLPRTEAFVGQGEYPTAPPEPEYGL